MHLWDTINSLNMELQAYSCFQMPTTGLGEEDILQMFNF